MNFFQFLVLSSNFIHIIHSVCIYKEQNIELIILKLREIADIFHFHSNS